MNITPTPTPPPDPDEFARGLAALEHHLAEVAPAAPTGPVELPTNTPVEPGQTRRVRQLRAEVAEAHQLAELAEDETPFLLDTAKVRKRRKRAAEAAQLHRLAGDPAALAYRDQRVRRTVTVMVMTAACIALAVSSIGVQASVAMALSLAPHTLGWWAAFGVEPMLSLPLLAAVAVQAYGAMRGHVVDRKSPAGKKLFRTEALLLGLTLVLNCWPAFVADIFDPLTLIVHSLGPVAAVTSIWVLPTLWAVLADLPLPHPSTPAPTALLTDALTGPEYRANTPEPDSAGRPSPEQRIETVTTHVRQLIAAGTLPRYPSANAIREATHVGMDTARAVRDNLLSDLSDPK
ncbi:hypothetical protein Aph01nite_62430 [Acrocarpospora phusangensis]|uniref:Uncharacterized protein n=1 Tax=Acrocarpospora phusangensis TaxID=1070424 RepID=A0A919URV8_9ACTN|nr:hypothetical protein [Acrocarpospora phusangensis]GIH27933.1 hypothetical protein Aph01nite_62430 [Acrocarpospora phusangensis]